MERPPPDHGLHDKVTLAELLSALSYALDLTEGQPAGHCVRCSHIGVEIGRHIGLGEQEITELYYVLLLKDLGCSSNAARICELYLTDDLTFKQDFKLIDGSLSQALRFVLSHTGLKAGLAERFRAIVNIFQNGGEIARELIETRCHRGADIARKMRFSEPVAEGIKNLDEHWDGSGKPLGLSGTAIPIYSRIALLAQVVDVFHVANGPEAALREAKNRSGVWFDPDLVAAFERVAASPAFLDMLGTDGGRECANSHAPAQASVPIDEDYLDDIAAAFAQVVDSKSPYTSGHSERVTLFTDLIAEELMFSAEQRRKLKRAALLHDIGKLGVSNAILDKPGKLDDAEWEIMRMHSAHSEAILSRIGAFRDLAPIAAAHHERLDGKGYPRGLQADQISLETRLITTADIFDALTADRPYRAAMSITQAMGIMSGMVGTQIDAGCFAALQRALGRVHGTLAA
ncbi:HD-GYP domain-containing protein [Bradyrhizobium sp. MOS003]|uniref:HD-GYP domain-containing protein n=1 Tax=Bradyrhizobium sp. MOS003 TaxID=2133946 RepID=UPI000D133374|nr:HD-GYP domain-containing protein [Bradyrhizobium sp. MOS003]PSO18412.1 metal-dependent phosphohydrolase [Bradyrhizobium sp. MOS003]